MTLRNAAGQSVTGPLAPAKPVQEAAQPFSAQIPNSESNASTPGLARREALWALDPSGRLPERYLKKPQVADMLQIDVRTVDDWMRKGIIPFVKFGRTVRFRASDIDAYVRENLLVSRRVGGAK